MTDRKLLALALAVFVVGAAFSGGVTTAVLSDTEVTTIVITVDAGNVAAGAGNAAADGDGGPVPTPTEAGAANDAVASGAANASAGNTSTESGAALLLFAGTGLDVRADRRRHEDSLKS